MNAVKNAGLKHLEKDEQLTFEVENSDKGPSAINLQKTYTNLKKNNKMKNYSKRNFLKTINSFGIV